MMMKDCACERERERAGVLCAYVCVRERKRDCVCVRERERERDGVLERERERERDGVREREREKETTSCNH